MSIQPTNVSVETNASSQKRKGDHDSDECSTDESSIAKRTRSTSGTRGISNADILNAIRSSEERIVKKLQTLLDLKITEVRSEFDTKLNALSSSIDDRIKAALESGSIADIGMKCEAAMSTIDSLTVDSNLRIESLERVQYLGDVIISGVPLVENEDTYSYFKMICDVVSFPRGVDAASSVFRLRNKSSSASDDNHSSVNNKARHIVSPPIIVKFVNIDFSRQFISSYLKFNRLNLTHLGFGTPSRIYINENLTKSIRELFRYCFQLKNNHKSIILKLFTRNGIVHVKFAGLDKLVQIHSKKEIDTYIINFAVEKPLQT